MASKQDFCQIHLTCADKLQAARIAHSLLEKNLVACVKYVNISSDFRWKDRIQNNKEVLLLMESKISLFHKVEAEVAKIHSYDTFVLEAVPVVKISKEAQKWLEEELNG